MGWTFRSPKPIADCTAWKRTIYYGVGGLTDVGFSEDESLLLVVSHAGRGLFNTQTGERVARDDEAPYQGAPWIGTEGNRVQGIGSAEGTWFSMAGLFGGALPGAAGNWKVTVLEKAKTAVLLEDVRSKEKWLLDEPISEIKALGFSNSGQRLVLGTSSEVLLFRNET